MKNNLDQLIFGFLLGGLLGSSAFYLLHATEKEKRAIFKRLGKISKDVGTLLEEVSVEDKEEAIDEILKSVPPRSAAGNLLSLAAIGIKIWKKRR